MNVTATPKTKTIAYHPGQRTVIEIWSEGDPEATIARLPSGQEVYDETALDVLNAVTHDDDILVREVSPREFDGLFN